MCNVSFLALNVIADGLASASYRGHSGKHMLVTSFSQPDPERTFGSCSEERPQ
jgi:hypothetical protein